MKRYSKDTWWSIGRFAVIVAAVGALLAFLSRGVGVCGNDLLSETVSPDGKWKAVIFAVDCGATTTEKELVPRVSVLRRDQQLSDRDQGNIFGAGNNGKSMLPGAVQASWTGSNELTIHYPSKASVFNQETKYKDVTIRYVAEP